MKIAFVPNNDHLLSNELFRYDGYDPTSVYGVARPGYSTLKQKLESDGHQVGTFDQFSRESVDRVVFIDNYSYYEEFVDTEDRPGLLYVMREPPSSIERNTYKNIIRMGNHFDNVLTWNDAVAAAGDQYTLYRLPQKEYSRPDESFVDRDYENKRLLANISSRKYSLHPNELYSERETIIDYYNQNHPNCFSLYGGKWSSGLSLSQVYYGRTLTTPEYDVFRGFAESKRQVYNSHLFALSFENMCGIEGYVSEKIFDCLRSGIVPVYYGASNVDDLIPEQTFIDYRDYRDPQRLHEYLYSISDKEYSEFLDCARDFLQSGLGNFAPEAFAATLSDAILNATPQAGLIGDIPTSFEAKAKADRMIHYADEGPASSITTIYDIAGTDPDVLFSKYGLKLLANLL